MTALHVRSSLFSGFGVVVFLLGSNTAISGPREQAKKIYDRLTGVPPTAQILDQMESLVAQGKGEEAAKVAIEDPFFYNLGLRIWLAPWTNVDENPMVPLNDYSATVIGMIRDEIPFNTVLTDDIIYVGAASTGAPPYNVSNNDHYADLQTRRIDLKANLQKQTQSTLTGITETAGVITTRGFAEAYFNMGTNRRAVRFTFKTFLCNDMENVSDTTIPDSRIRKDVERSPGGDSTVFRNKCAGCHAGMDALAGAFAHYDFDGAKLVNTPGTVQEKYSINATNFPAGYTTVDDNWENRWTAGQNAVLGWNGEKTGNGAKAYGAMLTDSEAFNTCMAKKVFTRLCLRPPNSPEDEAFIDATGKEFPGMNYNMKELFAKTAVFCTAD
jgi:hypothetical protein